jgi:hypothetical protein
MKAIDSGPMDQTYRQIDSKHVSALNVPVLPAIKEKGSDDPGRGKKGRDRGLFGDLVVVLVTGSYHQNCSSLPSIQPCPPDRLDHLAAAVHPSSGWLRSTNHVIVSNHPWPPLGIRGFHEANPQVLGAAAASFTPLPASAQSMGRKKMRRGTPKPSIVGAPLPPTFMHHGMIAGVLLANDTFGDSGFDWLVGGDDDTVMLLSVLAPYLRSSLNASMPLFLGVPGPSHSGRWYCQDNTAAHHHQQQQQQSNHSDSTIDHKAVRGRRGPVCCLNPKAPCFSGANTGIMVTGNDELKAAADASKTPKEAQQQGSKQKGFPKQASTITLDAAQHWSFFRQDALPPSPLSSPSFPVNTTTNTSISPAASQLPSSPIPSPMFRPWEAGKDSWGDKAAELPDSLVLKPVPCRHDTCCGYDGGSHADRVLPPRLAKASSEAARRMRECT